MADLLPATMSRPYCSYCRIHMDVGNEPEHFDSDGKCKIRIDHEIRGPREVTISGTFNLSILKDGEHANMKFTFPADLPREAKEWLRFTYCNDIVWRHHAGTLGTGENWFSTIHMHLYRKLFRHVHDKQYLVPDSE